MAVYKDEKRNTWFVVVRYTDWTGGQRQTTKRGFKTKREASAWESEFLLLKQGDMNMKLDDFVKVYFADKEGRLKDRSIHNKKYMIDIHIIPYLGNMEMNGVKPQDIISWQSEILSKGYSVTYQRMLQNQVTALFNHAERFYGLKVNPCKNIPKIGKANIKRMSFWTVSDFNRFINTFSAESDLIYIALFQLLFWTGCRVGEALALTKKDINFEDLTISISKTYYRLNKEDIISTPKTEQSNRIVTIPEALGSVIKDYVGRIYGLREDDRIFIVTDRAVQKALKRHAEKANVEQIRVHDIRHSHVAMLIENGVQPLLIMERLGHDNIKTTMNTYGHLYPNKQREVADTLQSILSAN